MKKWYRNIAIVMAGIMVVGSLAGCGSGKEETKAPAETPAAETPAGEATEPEYVFSVAMDAPEEESTYLYGLKFKEELEAKGNGRFQVDLYPNATLGNDREAMESAASGTVNIVIGATAPTVPFMPKLAIFDLPNAFPDLVTARNAVDDPELFKMVEQIYTDAGYKLLGVGDQGFRELTTKTEIKTLADLDGIKIRTMENNYHVEYWNLLGANATPMTLGETYIGLQQGTIDAQENTYDGIVTAKFHEQQKYLTNTNHVVHFMMFVMSGLTWDSMSAEDQALVQECVDTATEYVRGLADDSIASRRQELEDLGIIIQDVSDDMMAEIKTAIEPLYEEIRGIAGDELFNLYVSLGAGK